MSIVLVDSSAWIEAMRPVGDAAVRARVQALLATGTAAWCDMVRLELWHGARGTTEHTALAHMDATLPRLPIDATVWEASMVLGRKARAAGLNVPAADILIVACAQTHGVAIEHVDRHLHRLASIV